MEWLVFSVLMFSYLAIIIEFWPKSEPLTRATGPFRYTGWQMPNEHTRGTTQERIQEIIRQQYRRRKEREANRDKVNWKKEGF